MPDLTIRDLKQLRDARFLPIGDMPDSIRIPGISIDSRSVRLGQVFWALKGDRFDGHDYINDASQKNILLAVVSQSYMSKATRQDSSLLVVPDTLTSLQELAGFYRQKLQIPIIAVTGSNGKTTTKDMIAHILQQKFAVHKTTGNLNNHIGCPLTILEIAENHEAAVVELGTNHPGELSLLVQIAQPDQSLITNIGGAHLEFFKTVEGIAREKLTIFDGTRLNGTLYLNLDDPYIAAYRPSSRTVIDYSFSRQADVRGKLLETNSAGNSRWRLNDKTEIQMQIPGRPAVMNALAASAVAMNFGFTEPEIRDALEGFSTTDKRMQILNWNGKIIVNDAYNANPVSMKAAIDSVYSIKKRGRLYFVLGDMLELGERSLNEHIEILRYAMCLKPLSILLIGKEMHRACDEIDIRQRGVLKTMNDHESAARYLSQQLAEGDLLLLKGSRGMALEKILDHLCVDKSKVNKTLSDSVRV